MVTRIRQGQRPHLYVKEWREFRGLSLEQVAGRIGVERNTVWRWENEQHRLNPEKQYALAHAFDIEPEELWRPPSRPSLDAIMRNESDDAWATAADIVRRLTRRAS